MKNFFLTIAIIISSNVFAQDSFYTNLISKIKSTYPEINTTNKLISVNFWQAKDISSRDCNKQFDKVYSTYEFAKLKGGNKGIICFNVCIDENLAEISNQKDGIKKLIPISISPNNGLKNIVFNSNGEELYKNIESNKVFESIHQLITR
ncbi:MAG: hypothetical protein LCH32_04650 [Bacteroidetes bacterium]|nr:hypothetical protein [Bacteroidota bacterium]